MALTDHEPVSVLVLAPTPTHPTIQGNRQRIFDMCRAMQTMGADLTLLIYAVDGIDARSAHRMRQAWHNLEVVFPGGVAPVQSLVRYPAVDDWYDSQISDGAKRLCTERNFDVCFVNYAWYSKLFDTLRTDIVRVIDVHDIFGDRSERFEEIDLAPEWFHTSARQETIGLDRADYVLAIQSVEAEVLRKRSHARVYSVGFLSEPDAMPVRRREAGTRLKVGYVASGNPFNVASILSLERAFRSVPSASESVEVHVAGAVCKALAGLATSFRLHGIVEDISEFYGSLDVVVNPMLGGTGLKIKSLEALGYGKPLIATHDAMEGICSDYEGHQLKSPLEAVQRMLLLAGEPQRLQEEAAVSQQAYFAYRQEQIAQFTSFWAELTTEVQLRRQERRGAAD